MRPFSFFFVELEHLTMQYWATSACCFSVLIFLYLVLRRAPENVREPASLSVWHAKFSLSCIFLYTALCCVSLGTISLTGKCLSNGILN